MHKLGIDEKCMRQHSTIATARPKSHPGCARQVVRLALERKLREGNGRANASTCTIKVNGVHSLVELKGS